MKQSSFWLLQYRNKTICSDTTLLFSKAYGVVRVIIKLSHSASICTWASSVDCQPDYMTNIISLEGQLVERKTWIRYVVLMVDTMALHNMTIYDKKRESVV